MILLDLALNGLVQGSLLALICVGYSLAYGTAQVVNFPHADIMIAGGGYLVLLWAGGGAAPGTVAGMSVLIGVAAALTALHWQSSSRHRPWVRRGGAISAGVAAAALTALCVGRLPFFVATLLAVPATALLALGLYVAGYLPLIRRGAPRTSILLAALGLSIATESYLLMTWGSERRAFGADQLPTWLVPRAPPPGVGGWRVAWEYGLVPLARDVVLPVHDILIVGTSAVVCVLLAVFSRSSRIADAISAAADNRLAARACSIPVDRVIGYAFFVGGAVASLGGTLYTLRAKSIDPTAGFQVGILAFAACVLGGIGSLRGSIVGAFFVSMVASLAPAVPLNRWVGAHLSPEVVAWLPSMYLSDWAYGVVYVAMVGTILVKPRGLFNPR